MGLQKDFETQGQWLFRYRSYLPLVLLFPLVQIVRGYDFPWGSYPAHLAMLGLSLGLAVAGATVRLLVAGYVPNGTSGRNTKQQIAASLNTTGLYSVVRHPLYLGNFLLWGSVAVAGFHGWYIAVFCLAFWLYYERIMLAEEAFLRGKFGAEFDNWAARTPAFFPSLSRWIPSQREFSWKRAVRQEYTTFFLALESQVALHLFCGRSHGHEYELPRGWLLAGGIVLATYLAVRLVKKKTTLLATPAT